MLFFSFKIVLSIDFDEVLNFIELILYHCFLKVGHSIVHSATSVIMGKKKVDFAGGISIILTVYFKFQ